MEESFAQWLERRMTARSISKSSLAKATGVSRSAVYGWLDSSKPEPAQLVRLAAVFHVPLRQMYELAGVAYPEDLAAMAESAATYDVREVDPRVVSIALALANDAERLETWLDLGETLARRLAKELESRP